MTLDDALALIDPRMHEEFRRFYNTREASDDLLEYLDAHEQCVALVECALRETQEPTR